MPAIRTPLLKAAAFILVIGGILGTLELFPWQRPLNARLRVKALTFTYPGSPESNEKLFLENIRPLKTLNIQGATVKELFLSGAFSCNPSDSGCNEARQTQLQTLTELAIRFPNPSSRLRLTATPDADLVLDGLTLLAGTTVQNFAYLPQSDRLDFCLHQEGTPCSINDTTDAIACTSSAEATGNLAWSASTTLELSLSKVAIDALGIDYDPNNFSSLRLTYTPDRIPTEMALCADTNFSLSFHAQTTDLAPDEFNPARWVRQDIPVRNVRFIEQDITGDVRDAIAISTILSGKVRLGDRAIDLEPNQFLTLDSRGSGIDRLRTLEIQRNKANPGLQVDASGSKIHHVAVGFYSEFPVQTIRSTWLSAIPERFANVIFSVFVGIIGAAIGLALKEP